jgi:hypothetical protein
VIHRRRSFPDIDAASEPPFPPPPSVDDDDTFRGKTFARERDDAVDDFTLLLGEEKNGEDEETARGSMSSLSRDDWLISRLIVRRVAL